MEVGVLSRIAQEIGLPIGIFGLCVWLVVFIVKRLSADLDKLINNLTLFMSKVKDEHKQSSEEHKSLMDQHREMMIVMGRINGYKKE